MLFSIPGDDAIYLWSIIFLRFLLLYEWLWFCCLSFILKVNESFPFPIGFSWKGSGPESQNGVGDHQQSTVVFPKGNPIPSVKALTVYRSSTFSVDVHYPDSSELQVPPKISTYTVPSQLSTPIWFNCLHVNVVLYWWNSIVLLWFLHRLALFNLPKVNVQKWKWKLV